MAHHMDSTRKPTGTTRTDLMLPVKIIKATTPVTYLAIWSLVMKKDKNSFYEFDKNLNCYFCNIGCNNKVTNPTVGQIICVRHPKNKRWYRACIETILESSVGYTLLVFLLDAAEKTSVSMEWSCILPEKFLKLSFQSCLLVLPGLIPCSAVLNPVTLSLEYNEAENWDVRSKQFVCDLMRESPHAEVEVLHRIDDIKAEVNLYLAINGNLVCVNDLLVKKQYALSLSGEGYLDHPDISLQSTALSSSSSSSSSSCTSDRGSLRSRQELELMKLSKQPDESDLHTPGISAAFAKNENCSAEVQPYFLRLSPPSCHIQNKYRGFASYSSGDEDDDSADFRSCCALPKAANNQFVTENVSSEDMKYKFAKGSSCSKSSSSSSSYRSAKSESVTKLNKSFALHVEGDDIKSLTPVFEPTTCSPNKPMTKHIWSIAELNMKSVMYDEDSKGDDRIHKKETMLTKKSEFRHSKSSFKTPGRQSRDIVIAQSPNEDKAIASKIVANEEIRNLLKDTTKSPGVPCLSMSELFLKQETSKANHTLLSPPPLVERHSKELSISNSSVRPLLIEESSQQLSVLRNSLSSPPPLEKLSVSSSFLSNVKRDDQSRNGRISAASSCSTIDSRRYHRRDGSGKTRSQSSLKSSNNQQKSLNTKTDFDDCMYRAKLNFDPPPLSSTYFCPMGGDQLDLVDVGSVPKIFVYGSVPPSPLRDIRQAQFDTDLLHKLAEIDIVHPTTVQAYVWPAITRGRNIVVMGKPESGKTISYLVPLISSMKSGSNYSMIPVNNEPLALILCATSQKVRKVNNAACKIIGNHCNVKSLWVHGGGYEENQLPLLANGCDILVTTPCSLLRLLNEATVLTGFSRLCHLVVDDADVLTDIFRIEMKELLKLLLKPVKKRSNEISHLQYMVFGTKWTKLVRDFIQAVMLEPLLFFASYCESVVATGIQAKAHTVQTKSMLGQLKKIVKPIAGKQRIVICVTHRHTVNELGVDLKDVCEDLIIAHHGNTRADIIGVNHQWSKQVLAGKKPVLLVTDKILDDITIEDADCLIHYVIPNREKSLFERRFVFLMEQMRKSDVFRNDPEKAANPNCITHIFITEKCLSQVQSLITLLNRLRCEVEHQLKAFALSYYECKEEQKMGISLCYYLKAFGTCPKRHLCTDRHLLISKIDAPSSALLRGGFVELSITTVQNASHLCGRVVKYQGEDGKWKCQNAEYLDLALSLSMHYSNKKNIVRMVDAKPGDLGAVLVDLLFHRVRLLYKSFIRKTDNVREVQVFFVDEGYVDYFEESKILRLPKELAEVPQQIFEVFLCNVRPVDMDQNWTFKAHELVELLVENKIVIGTVQLSLGNILWLSSVRKIIKHKSFQGYSTEFDLSNELLKNNYAMKNPDHISKLEALCCDVFDLPQPIVCNSATSCKTNHVGVPSCAKSAFLPMDDTDEWVLVSYVDTPGRFYVQRLAFISSLDELMDDIKKHIKWNTVKGMEKVAVDNLCLAPLPADNNNYYRARILEVSSSSSETQRPDLVRVFCLDYGDVCTAKVHELLPLTENLIWKVPFQAIECRLAGIEPNDGNCWTDTASDAFYRMTVDGEHNRQDMYAKVLKKVPAVMTFGNGYEVDLYDLCDEDLDLSAKLCYLGFARDVIADEQGEVEMLEAAGTLPQDNIESKLLSCCNEECGSGTKTIDKLPVLEASHNTRKIPLVQWAQQFETISLKVVVNSVNIYQFSVDGKLIKFSASVNQVDYDFNLELFDEVKQDFSVKICELCLYITLNKVNAKRWPRLIESTKKLSFVSVDFDRWIDSDDENELIKLSSASKQTSAFLPDVADAADDHREDVDCGSSDSDDRNSLIDLNEDYPDFL